MDGAETAAASEHFQTEKAEVNPQCHLVKTLAGLSFQSKVCSNICLALFL